MQYQSTQKHHVMSCLPMAALYLGRQPMATASLTPCPESPINSRPLWVIIAT